MGMVTVSPLVQVGSFVNAGDRRHNRTIHRYDHSKTHNISTSFDPNKFICTICNIEHPVLHRTIEGNDVGLDNPPVFILSDQNFPSMVPAGGEGECLKIILIENGSLTELVEVFLGMTRGFDVPAGSVLLLASASCAAAVGTAEYAAKFVWAAGVLRGAFAGGVNVMHGIPFLIGGTKNTTAIRALAEIQQWVHCTSIGTDDIFATRKVFATTLRTDTSSSAHSHVIKLPSTQSGGERVSFVVSGFHNLKSAVDPMAEEDEKVLLVLLLEELNTLYPVNLDTDIVCDRFMEADVFYDKTTDRTDLVLIGASHLANIAKHLENEKWKVTDLTKPGWLINKDTVEEMMATVTDTAAGVNLESAVVILQLFDSSVYLVNKSDGEKRLPRKDRHGTYHIEGSLVVADKSTVKDLVQQLVPLLKLLGNSRKILLTPLARYWVAPCCSSDDHHINYNTPSYLSALGDAVHALRDHIRDCLFTRRIPNFWILCPNRMIGVGQRKQVPSDEEAAKAAALWGNNPVHPTAAAYRCMADCLISDIQNEEAKYTNPSRPIRALKRPKVDLSQERDNWVTGCSAAAPRRDIDVQLPLELPLPPQAAGAVPIRVLNTGATILCEDTPEGSQAEAL